jgi:pteridine reductase
VKLPLAGKVALVTGAGKRVGKSIALALAEDGATVAVHYNGSASGARDTVRAITRAGGEASAFRANLTKVGEAARLVREVIGELGRIDLLVNSAASMHRTPLDRVRENQWDEIFALNLRAPFFLTVAASTELKKRRGAVINISDHMGFESWPDFVPHGISKAGVAAMTHALAAALAPRVRVNAIAPGFVLAPEGYPASRTRAFANETPLKRLGSPEDVAGAVLYLASARYVTGHLIFVDGGRHGAR